MDLQTIKTLADAYREEWQRVGGYVVIYDGAANGWTLRLDNPGGWMPGCLAVEQGGAIYEARGGNDYHGAAEWVPLS